MDRNAADRHDARRKGALAVSDAVIAMMDLNLTPTEITAILAEQIARLAWRAAKPRSDRRR